MSDLNEHLALKVMGYIAKDGGYFCEGERVISWIKYWNPPENIEQAMMLINEFRWVTIQKLGSTIVVTISHSDTCKSQVFTSDSMSYAISLASARATEWKE